MSLSNTGSAFEPDGTQTGHTETREAQWPADLFAGAYGIKTPGLDEVVDCQDTAAFLEKAAELLETMDQGGLLVAFDRNNSTFTLDRDTDLAYCCGLDPTAFPYVIACYDTRTFAQGSKHTLSASQALTRKLQNLSRKKGCGSVSSLTACCRSI